MLLLLLVGCPQEEIEDAPASEHVPYVYEETTAPEPSLDADALQDAIDEAVAGVLTVHGGPILDAYQEVMSGSEETCPDYYDYEGNQYWYDECTSSSGSTFGGYGFWYVYDNWDDGYGNLYSGNALYGVGSVVTADGQTFEFGGSAYQLIAVPSGYTEDDPDYYRYHLSVVQGGFSYDGAAAEGTWLAGGGAPDLSTTAAYWPSYDARMVSVDGGFSDLEGDVVTAVVLEEVLLMSEDFVPDCPGEPHGLVSVRDQDGQWYDVIFDGPAEYGAETDPELCDGCGAAFFRGESIGEVCADFSPLLDWETAPW